MKMRLVGASAILVFAVCSLSCRADNDTGTADFETRRKALLAFASAAYDQQGVHVKDGFWVAEALMEMGRTADAVKLANAGMAALEPGNKQNRWLYGGNSGFLAWPALDFYLRYKDRLDDATRRRYARIYQGAVWYRRLTTSNHTLMAATERYLATQEWGENFKPDPVYASRPDAVAGTRFSADDPSGEHFLNRRIDEVIKQGCEEYASRPYGSQDILPFLTLAECSRDPVMQARARQAYVCAIAELAGTYLRGHLATFSTRSYPDLLSQQPWGVASLLWVYFGGAGTTPSIDWGLRAATTNFTLPAAVQTAGTDRSRPYTDRSLNGGWRLTTYMTDSYALFSRSAKGSGKPPVLLGQNYPCGVMFLEPDAAKHSFLWLTNPCADDDARRNPTGIHTHGATRYEQEVQDEGTLLYVFNVPATAPYSYALGFIPGGYLGILNESETTGRVILGYQSLLIAITSSAKFSWHPENGIKYPAGKPAPGDSEFRIDGPHLAVAFDTARPGDIPGATPEEKLKAFAAQVSAQSRIELRAGSSVTGHYVDHLGRDLVCTFGGDDTIDGHAVDYARWPRLENPWLRFAPPDALRLNDGIAEETIHFDAAPTSSSGSGEDR